MTHRNKVKPKILAPRSSMYIHSPMEAVELSPRKRSTEVGDRRWLFPEYASGTPPVGSISRLDGWRTSREQGELAPLEEGKIGTGMEGWRLWCLPLPCGRQDVDMK